MKVRIELVFTQNFWLENVISVLVLQELIMVTLEGYSLKNLYEYLQIVLLA